MAYLYLAEQVLNDQFKAELMSRHGYTISYLDGKRNRCEFCAYANDSYEARQVVMETIQFLYEHPNAIDHILRSS